MADQQKRKYTFKDQEYWTKARAPKKTPNGMKFRVQGPSESGWEPASFNLSTASSAYSPGSRGGDTTTYRRNQVARKPVTDDMINLQYLPLPYIEKNGRISVRDSIQLCQRVYANIAIFRNTIDIMTEFSCADIYLTGGNAASRTFITNWLKKIGIEKLQEQFFREYFRSGNVFLLKFDGAFTDEDFKKLKITMAAKFNKLPIRYTVLNPSDIVIFTAASFENAPYRKVMNEYELEALRARKTDEDKQLYKALPEDVKKQVDAGTYGPDGIWMPIPFDRLYPVFYKKQPYEPFAIPFGYPVLRDLNHKEELKKIDQAIARTIDNVILLVTMGEKKDAEGNGMNPDAMKKMQELLQNESVGRVLVSDYTTEMKFIIPDIGEILNPDKYKIVNEDIKQGLLNILSGEDKFANAMMKTQIFLERLKEGRKAFRNEFLQKEIENVCKAMGFKSAPKANHQEVDLKDEVQYAKVYTRLMEIGVLTAEQGLKAMQTGIFPEPEQMTEAQKTYHEERQAGMYNPLLGGVPQVISPEGNANRQNQKEIGHAKMTQDAKKAGVSQPNSPNNGRPEGSSSPQSTKNVSPQGTSHASIAKRTKHPVSVKGLTETIREVSKIMDRAESAVKEKFGLTELNDNQKRLVYTLTSNVISSSKKGDWQTQLDAVLKEPEKHLGGVTQNEISVAVEELASEHGVDSYSASILYHSKWQQ